jgi:hypothetical protein
MWCCVDTQAQPEPTATGQRSRCRLVTDLFVVNHVVFETSPAVDHRGTHTLKIFFWWDDSSWVERFSAARITYSFDWIPNAAAP